MFKIKGITDEVGTCDCCGRTDLKRTVVLESETTGIVHYGCDCAARAMSKKMTRKTVETIAEVASFAAQNGPAFAIRQFGFGRPEHFIFESK